MLLVLVIALWSISLIVEILSLGSLALLMALAIVAIIGFIAIKVLTRMHGQLVTTFSETFVGGTVPAASAGPPSDQPHRVPAGTESEPEQTIATSDSPVLLADAEMIAL